MEWLTIAAVKAFIKRYGRLLLLILFGLLVVAALLIQAGRERSAYKAGEKAGADKVQKNWDKAIARGKEEIARLDRENAAAEAKALAEAIAIGESRSRDLQDAIAERDRTIAGLRAGQLRLRKQWAGCLSAAGARQDAESPAWVDGQAGSREGDALDLAGAVGQSIFIADDYDSRVTRLQEFVQVQQEFMRSACHAE